MKTIILLAILGSTVTSSADCNIPNFPLFTDREQDTTDYTLIFTDLGLNGTWRNIEVEIQHNTTSLNATTCIFHLFLSFSQITNILLEPFKKDSYSVLNFEFTSNKCKISFFTSSTPVYAYLMKHENGFLNFVSAKKINKKLRDVPISELSVRKANRLDITQQCINTVTSSLVNGLSRDSGSTEDYFVLTGFIRKDTSNDLKFSRADNEIYALSNDKMFVLSRNSNNGNCTQVSGSSKYKMNILTDFNNIVYGNTCPGCDEFSNSIECTDFRNNQFKLESAGHSYSVSTKLGFKSGLNFVYFYMSNTGFGSYFEIRFDSGNVNGTDVSSVIYGYYYLTSYDTAITVESMTFTERSGNYALIDLELLSTSSTKINLTFNSGTTELKFKGVEIDSNKKGIIYIPMAYSTGTFESDTELKPTTASSYLTTILFAPPQTIARTGAISNFDFLSLHELDERSLKLNVSENISFPEGMKLVATPVSLNSINKYGIVENPGLTGVSVNFLYSAKTGMIAEFILQDTSFPSGEYDINSSISFSLVNRSNTPDFTETLFSGNSTVLQMRKYSVYFVLKDSNGHFIATEQSIVVIARNKADTDILCDEVGKSSDETVESIFIYKFEFRCSEIGDHEVVVTEGIASAGVFDFEVESNECDLPDNVYYVREGKCISVCPEEMPFNFDFECLAECPGYVPFYLEDKTCVSDCQFAKIGNKCVDDCGLLFKDGKDCMDSCGERYVDSGECVEDCGEKYRDGNNCVDKCSIYHREDLECVDNCSAPYLFKHGKGGLFYCLSECPDGLLPNSRFRCVETPTCKEKQQIIDFECVDCGPIQVWINGKCLFECPKGYLNSQGICLKCDKYIHKGECVAKCPVKTQIVAKNNYRECKNCIDIGKIVEEGKCVSKCSEFKILQGEECLYCPIAFKDGKCVDMCDKGSTPHPVTKACLGCGNEYAYDDGICTSDCPYFKYTDGQVKRCVKCRETQFFYLGECVNKCPENTEPLLVEKKCQPLPTNCKIDGFKCQNSSKCIQSTSSYASCACTLDRIGLSCSTRKDKLKEESEEIANKFKSSTDLNVIRTTKSLAAANSSIAEKLIREVDSMIETVKDEYSLLELLDISLIPDKSEINSNRALETLLSKVRNTSRRVLQSNSIYFDGLNFKYAYGNDISSLIDVSGCTASIATENNISAESIIQEYFEFNLESSKHLDSKLNGFKINSSPLIVVFFYHLASNLSSTNCSASDLEIEFSAELEDKEKQEKVATLSDKGVNAFDSKEDFFTDICSLKQGSKDVTLLSRKEDFLLDANEVCGTGVGINCRVDSLDQFNRPICVCKRGSESFWDLILEYLTFLSETNIRLVKCYSVFFSTESLRTYGFWSTMTILVSFYVLQISSHRYTKKLLEKANLGNYLQETVVNIEEEPEDLLHQSVIIIDKKENRPKKRRKKSVDKSDKSVRSRNSSIINKSADKSINSARGQKSDRSEVGIKSKEDDEISSSIKHILRPKGVLTNLDLNSASFEQKLKYDERSLKYFISRAVLKFHPYMDVLFNKTLYFPLHLRLFVLMSSINLEFALNALFFTDETINRRAKAENPVLA